eukprot:Phypoly_transcript_04263.p1 GENE.Phypoly_transcript_04263~~Phypoly_transcript_04263.p1  ORF type:complete len:684 (+),score=110.29 Phypoly_transcript_04263:23-2053(+)
MENEEDFLHAAAILKELDLQLASLSESALNKQQVEIRKEIDSQFEKCTRAIQARKENLIREVEGRFQDKRRLQEAKQQEVKTTIETCRKLLLAGVGVYNKDRRDEAVNIWKSLNEYMPKNGESDQIQVKFSDNFLSYVAEFGAVSATFREPSRLSKSYDLDLPKIDTPTKLNKSSNVEPSKLNKSSSVDPPKLNKSSNIEPSKLGKSSSVDPPKMDKSPNLEPTKLNKSSSVDPPKLNKSSNIEHSKLRNSASVDPPTSKSSTESSKHHKSNNVEHSTKLGKSSAVEPSKSGKSSSLSADSAPNTRLGKTSAVEGLKLDKVPSVETSRLGKTSQTDSRSGKAEGPLSPRDKTTLTDSPKGEKRAASQNRVSTLTELNYGLEGRVGTNAQLRHPNGICFNPHDRCLYVCDNGHVIFKVTSAGEVKLFAAKRGDGQLQNPMGITCYHKENCFYVTSQLQHSIKMINSMGIVTVVAGCGKEGQLDGIGLKTGFSHPVGITVDQLTGDLYVADFGNHTIRKITSQGVVTTLAGAAGKKGFADGVGKTAAFNCPLDICFNAKDQSLVVCDSNNHKIRRVALNGEVTTLGEISRPSSIAITPNGSFIVASQSENKVYHLFKTLSGGYKIETIAGTGKKGGEDGSGAESSFSFISGIALDEKSNICYAAEHEFSRIRRILLQS